MARIRSIKPEFWKSEAIAVHSFRTRLTFIGLWTYVDDNGVGLDNPRLVAAELFALEDDPREALANVREDLANLHAAGRIRRYTVDGKSYLAIVNWREHQKIDKPGKARYPEPDDPGAVETNPATSRDALSQETVATSSRDIPEPVATPHRLDQGSGSSGSGNRGAGDRGVPPTAARELALIESSAIAPALDPTGDTAQTIIGEWLDRCAKRPASQVIGQTAKLVKSMLAEGIDSDDIRRGMALWKAKGAHPSVLPSIVNEIQNAGPTVGASTTDQRVNQGLALAAKYAPEDAP